MGSDVPTRSENLEGLPSTFIDVGTVDLFRDEDLRLTGDGGRMLKARSR